MTIYMIHVVCGKPIATFVGKELPEAGSRISSRDFRLMNGRRPTAFGPIVCPHCKTPVPPCDLSLEPDNVVKYIAAHSDRLGLTSPDMEVRDD